MDKNSQQINFDFRIFLEEEIEKKIKQNASKLLELTPISAKAKLSLTMPFRQVKGIFSIRFLGQTYSAEAKDPDPLKVWEKLEFEIMQQINSWKENRFQTDTLNYQIA